MVLYDHMAQIGLYIDEMGVNGQGAADQPLGILNQVGINSVTFGGSASSAYKNVVAMETAIRKANIYEEISFISTSVGRGTLRITPATLTGSTVVSGATNALWTENGGEEELIGRPAVDSQQIPNDYLIALVGRHLVMAQWGGLAVVLDTITRANQDEYRLSINTYVDFALRHAQAVSRSADSIASLT
jgi:HK97 family phage major capsid protein